MNMTAILTFMLCASALYAALTGNAAQTAAAVSEGAAAAVRVCVSAGGTICLWSGVMEVMRASGLSGRLAAALKRPLRLLFPGARDEGILRALAENLSANLLGLGGAATPPGIRAARLMAERADSGRADGDLMTLVVLNSASVQLIPATAAALRASAGAKDPFDILPAVWITSLVSVVTGLAFIKLSCRFGRKRP